jgi:putative oxidoreductase
MKRKMVNILAGLLGLLILNGGLNKLFHYMPIPDDLDPEVIKDMNALNEIVWLMPLIAVAEIFGSVLFIIPRTRALGILILFPVLIGALLSHIFVDLGSLGMILLIWLFIIWMIYENRRKYLSLLRK